MEKVVAFIKKETVLTVAYQTLAANLGSMLTPIGNPQNIYLFGLSGMDVSDFILLMLPYTCLSALLLMAGIISSQFISNVPAALLLSEFTTKISNLIIGVNLGGLGTLIASMASLISFKLLAHNYNELKGRHLIYFTVAGVVFLMILLLLQIA